ncbi:MAG: rod shape-determining protein RodA [Bacteroidaceae bacterium]|nr:rod shape-determining protein RodA [Bacteroidaceae bacterium]
MVNRNADIIRNIDWATVALVAAVMICGWFSVVGSSSESFSTDLLSFSTRPGKQLVWMLCAVVLSALVMSITQLFYNSYSYIIYVAFMILLLATIFLAHEHKGSRSWLDLGPVSLQPAEFAKFATALALAKFTDKYSFNSQNFSDIVKAAGLILIPMSLIVMQNETGSALVYLAFVFVLFREGLTGLVLYLGAMAVVIFIVALKYADVPVGQMPFNVGKFVVLLIISLLVPAQCWVMQHDRKTSLSLLYVTAAVTAVGMLFSGFIIPFDVTYLQVVLIVTISLWLVFHSFKAIARKYLVVAGISVLGVVYLFSVDYVFNDILQDHQRSRINVILGLEDDPKAAGYNVNQSMIAIGSGGFAGKGFMEGTQTRLKYVPEQDTDFIFCTVGEEQGFLGSSFVLLLYLALILRLLFLAERQPSVFGRVYGYSVLCILLFHVFVNVGMVLGITPVIGIPLPFFSYGGSSLWGFTILLSIFLRIDAERLASY